MEFTSVVSSSDRQPRARAGYRALGTLVTVACAASLAASCGGSDSSGTLLDELPKTGAPCPTADIVIHLDASNSDVACRLGEDGDLVWVEQGAEDKSDATEEDPSRGPASSSDIPAVMETFGIDLAPFDPATGMAGSMKITGIVPPKLPSNDPNKILIDARNEYLFLPFGYEVLNVTDPQWAFFVPLGTPVVSLISGTVCDVALLYSNDFSIRVVPDGTTCTRDGTAGIMFETEHVIDPLVEYGDRVTAGQKIATVSDYQKAWTAIGLGIVEVGVFFNPDNTAWHACPSRFFAPSVRDSMLDTLDSVMKAWSAEIAKPDMFATANDPVLGCFTSDVNDGRQQASGD